MVKNQNPNLRTLNERMIRVETELKNLQENIKEHIEEFEKFQDDFYSFIQGSFSSFKAKNAADHGNFQAQINFNSKLSWGVFVGVILTLLVSIISYLR